MHRVHNKCLYACLLVAQLRNLSTRGMACFGSLDGCGAVIFHTITVELGAAISAM